MKNYNADDQQPGSKNQQSGQKHDLPNRHNQQPGQNKQPQPGKEKDLPGHQHQSEGRDKINSDDKWNKNK